MLGTSLYAFLQLPGNLSSNYLRIRVKKNRVHSVIDGIVPSKSITPSVHNCHNRFGKLFGRIYQVNTCDLEFDTGVDTQQRNKLICTEKCVLKCS